MYLHPREDEVVARVLQHQRPFWHRCTTLDMLAHAFLAVTTAADRRHTPTPAGLLDVTVNELRGRFDALLHPTRNRGGLLCWSVWRRRYQARP